MPKKSPWNESNMEIWREYNAVFESKRNHETQINKREKLDERKITDKKMKTTYNNPKKNE